MTIVPTIDLGTTLRAALAGGYVAQLDGGTYNVTQTIVININSTAQGALGLNGRGATLVSQVINGQPVIEIVVGPNVDLRYLNLSNFTIQGNGLEGDGIKIVAAGNDRWVYNWNVDNVTVQHVGGYGLDVQGSIFEGLVSNSWMNSNGQGGAYFSHLGGGQVSAVRWFGGGADNNGGSGLVLNNGARDMSVDGASFVNNGGAGISAMSGITSVTDSDFQNNHGAGVNFQLYGNFNHDTFSTSGAQTVGISGYMAGDTSLIGNVASGAETLANLTGNGTSLQTGNTGQIGNGLGVTVAGLGAGNHASVTVSSQGFVMPTISTVTAATTAAAASSHGTSVLETSIVAVLTGGASHLTDTTYTVTAPIVINVTSSSQGGIIDLGGAKITSQIAGSEPVIEIVVGAGVNLSGLTLENFSINGSGGEGDGIKIVADGTDRSVTNLNIKNVNVEHTGGVGLDVLGNVTNATISNAWMNGNALGGARFANSANGGVASGLEWEGGGFRKNGGAGLILENGTHDMSVKGLYFVENNGPGIYATSGIAAVQASGFENNQGAGAFVQGSSNFTDDTFSTWGTQDVAVAGYLASGQLITITDPDKEYYGSGVDSTVLANVQGSGTLALAAGGAVVVGPQVTVTGAQPVLFSATTGTPIPPVPTAPIVHEALASDTGASATDKITSNPALSGAADPNAVVHFTVDGSAIAATTTANARGAWGFTPTGLADGSHTIVASETNAGGAGSASVTFTLDTTTPVVTERLTAGGTAVTSPALFGTGDANAAVRFTVDGSAIAATATADSTGAWAYTPTGLASGSHAIVASETDVAGNVGSVSVSFTLSPLPVSPTVTEQLKSDTGASASDKITSSSALSGTADPNAVVHFTIDGATVAATATANGNGAWAFTPSDLRDGAHTIVASEINAAGVTGAAASTFTLDTQGDSPIFTNALFANGQVTVTGSTGAANDTVSLYDGSTWIGIAKTDINGDFAFSETSLPTVVHSFGANATDLAGNEAHSAAKLVVGGTPPVPTPKITETLANDTGISATDRITLSAAVVGTADPNTIVHFTVDGASASVTTTANASGVWAFTPGGLSDGQHIVVASETNAGGTGTASLSFALDTIAPALSEKLVGGGTGATTAALTGTTEPNALVHFIVDGSPIATSVTADATGVWSYTPPGLANGQHTVVASVTDLAGNAGTASLSFGLIPAVPTLTEGLAYDTGASSIDRITSIPALAGTADANVVVHFTVDGSAIAATATANAAGAWSYTPTGLVDGLHTIVASETNAGGTGAASLTFTLDRQPPVPVVTGGTLVNGQVTLIGTVGGEAGDTISIYDGNSWQGFITSDSTGHWSFSTAAAANVVHSYGVNVTDLAGNEGHSITPYVIGGTLAPTPMPEVTESLVADTGASATDKITSNPALLGTADPNAVVHFTVDESAIAATTTANASGAWGFTPTGLADGSHTIVASETNATGGSGAAAISFTLDTHAPIPLFTGAKTASGLATVGGTTGEANDAISLYDGNAWIGLTTTGTDGTFSITVSASSNVVHSYGANALDLTGSEGHGGGKLILGSSVADTLVGSGGNDVIVGNGGGDTITGGAGADTLTGGSGNVTFAYNAATDSNFSTSDVITDFRHGSDKIDFTNIAGINATTGIPQFQGTISGSSALTLNAHSVAFVEVGGNTQVLVNATATPEAVTVTDTHAADMKITLVGVNLGLTASDFHHV
jgi:hypothetical protein